jgi:competence ComEA-like helix-hairpin-helix protein
MDMKSDNQELIVRPMKTAFFIGVILCFCFALPILPNFKKTNFAPLDNKLNPNTASVYELAQLPAIGPARAQAIADYRKDEKFENAKDVEKVKGIGEKTVNKIKPFLKFNDTEVH